MQRYHLPQVGSEAGEVAVLHCLLGEGPREEEDLRPWSSKLERVVDSVDRFRYIEHVISAPWARKFNRKLVPVAVINCERGRRGLEGAR